MILIYKFFFPISTKGNLVPFKQGYTYMGREQTSALSFSVLHQSGRLNDSEQFGFTEGF